MGECGREVEFAKSLAEVNALAKDNKRRIDDLEQKQNTLESMATSIAVLAEKQNTMSDKMDSIDHKVSAIEQKPAKKWDSFMEQAFGIILAALMGFLLARIGL